LILGTMDKQVVVIIPFHKTDLSHNEQVALEQCFRILSNHVIVAVKPHGLVLSGAVTRYNFSAIESFDDTFFRSVQGYNELMLSDVFYGRFLAYEYILIHQLDAFVFKDDLAYWCSLDIDYVGAPWMRKKEYPNILKAAVSKSLQYFAKRYDIKKHGLPSKKQFDDNVGNGGFSLRRVKKFHDICLSHREKIAEYNSKTEHHYNEDAFWAIEVNRKRKVLNIPGYKKALQFAFELAPDRSYCINNQKLPFGCHAWDLYLDFWRPFFKENGYII